MPEGTLFVCATPIGNLGDVSDRLRQVLESADVVYAEDTRRTRVLLGHIGARPPVHSLFTGNERASTTRLLADLSAGRSVALVSDAGTPTVSDPGADAVRAAREAGHAIVVIPGPSAVVAAIALAGFGGDRFVFEGFLPRKGKARRDRLDGIAGDPRAVVLFAAPHRLNADLSDLVEACGAGRQVVVARELTKIHEESWAGSLAEATQRWAGDQKGEFTLVIGPGAPRLPDLESVIASAAAMVDEGMSVADAARRAATRAGVGRRQVYEALLARQEPN